MFDLVATEGGNKSGRKIINVGDKRLRRALYLLTFYSEIMPTIYWYDFQEYLGSYPTFQDRMI